VLDGSAGPNTVGQWVPRAVRDARVDAYLRNDAANCRPAPWLAGQRWSASRSAKLPCVHLHQVLPVGAGIGFDGMAGGFDDGKAVMADPWELVLHHTYSGTPGVIFDQSPSRRSHGQPVGLSDADFLTDGAAPGSGAVRFHSATNVIRVPASQSWAPMGGVRIEMVCSTDMVSNGGTLVTGDSFDFRATGNGYFSGEFASTSGGGSGFGEGGLDPRPVPSGEWMTLGLLYQPLPASGPERTAEDGTVLPAVKGVRLHGLRHTAAVLWLTAGVHCIQVAKWLGHSSHVLTLTTYADYIPEVEAENPLPEPVAAVPNTNVIKLFRVVGGLKADGLRQLVQIRLRWDGRPTIRAAGPPLCRAAHRASSANRAGSRSGTRR
jgi:hypothetical protein